MDLRQTFVVGRAGTLDTVSVYGDDFGAAVTLQVISAGGIADKQTVSMTGSHWTQVTLTTPPKVTSGEVMTLALTPSGMINWYGTCDNLYASGQALVYDPSARVVESIPAYGISTGNSIGYCTLDFAFQTYVTTAIVATPAPTPKLATPAPTPAKPAATSSLVAAAAPSGTAATPSDTTGASNTAAAPSDTAAPTADSAPSQPSAAPVGSASGDSGGSIGIILIVLVTLLAVAAGAWWFLAARQKRSQAGKAP
jgi:hypothetical protein